MLIGCNSGHEGNEVRDEKKNDHSVQKTKRVNITDIEAGIKSYIKAKAENGDGYFHFEDEDRELQLKLVRVHTEYLSNLGEGRYFACVDLADVSGDVYDFDFFMGGTRQNMEITQTTLHKLNGKPFYTWKQRDDKSWHQVSVKDASRELLGVKEGKDAFEFSYKIQLPEITGNAKMWVPLAKTDSFQTVNVASLTIPGSYEILGEKENGNSILYIELSTENSGETAEILYEVERLEKGPYEDSKNSPEKYLNANMLLPVGGRFHDIAIEAIDGKQDDSKLMQARALYDYIIDNMQYRKAGKYGTGDANYACDSRSGNCTEFHSFFISLARSVGIPARFGVGASIPSARNEGGINGYHCWAEFYADGKWWPIDISEGNKYTALATYYFGHHPANRIEFSKGRDLIVKPGPNSGPINFFAYPVLEIEGKSSSVETIFTFSRKTG